MDVDASVSQHLLELERQLLQPDVRHSRSELEQLLADEFLEFGSSGSVYRKREVVDAVQHESPRPRSLSEFRAVALADGVVLTTYRIAQQGADGSSPAHSLRSSIWKLTVISVNGRCSFIKPRLGSLCPR